MTLRTVASTLALDRSVYERRLGAVAEHDFFLLSSSDAEWLTGVPRVATWSEYDPSLNEAMTACLVGANGPTFSIAHSLWHLEAGQAMREWQVEEYGAGTDPIGHLRRLADAAGWRAGQPILVPAATPLGQTMLLRHAFPTRAIETADAVLGPQRARKDPAEIDTMRDAARSTAAGIRAACERLRPGVTRLDLFAAVREEILAHGLDDVSYGPDCWATGPAVNVDWSNARTMNANPTLDGPCSVSLDVGAVLRGYRADVGRTIFIGEPPARSAEALAAIAEARSAGAPFLSPGRQALEVDDATRTVIAGHGFASGQWIPSGHGIGLDFHEPPTLGEDDGTILADGNVVTFELAVWQTGIAGAFAEDTVVVRDAGLEWLIDDGDQPLLIC